MARRLKVDMTGVEAFIKASEGRHVVRIKSIEEKTSQGGNDMLACCFEVTRGEDKGARVYENYPLVDTALWKLKAMLQAVGMRADGKISLDLDRLEGKILVIEVKHEEYNGSTIARIQEYRKLSAESEDDEDEDYEDDEEEAEDEKPVKKPSKKAQVGKTTGKKKKPVEEDEEEPDEDFDDEDEDDEEEEQPKKPAKKPVKKSPKKKAPEPEDDEDFDEDDEEEEPKPVKKPAKKTSKPAKKAKKPEPEDEDDDDDEDEEDWEEA